MMVKLSKGVWNSRPPRLPALASSEVIENFPMLQSNVGGVLHRNFSAADRARVAHLDSFGTGLAHAQVPTREK